MKTTNIIDMNVLILDVQTTGMRPPKATPIEIAWTATTARSASENAAVTSHFLRLPPGHALPAAVSRLTGISESDLQSGLDLPDAGKRLHDALKSVDALVIHYAQFEMPFLNHILRAQDSPEEIAKPVLCTQLLIKRLFPALPSVNIRASAGYFGVTVRGANRAGPHVEATERIWRGVGNELDRLGLTTPNDVAEWIANSAPPKAARYEYRVERLRRLTLPASPGVYRMLSKSREILYVGKATSLRDRVNSYFRGKKGRDRFKLEMMAQVWDIEVIPCGSPLEAALLESDEIKRWDPPYNLALKTGHRQLVFYSRAFDTQGPIQTPERPIGPFRPMSWIENLIRLARSVETGRVEQVFWNPIDETDLRAGFELMCARHGLDPASLKSTRRLLAAGHFLLRRYGAPAEQAKAADGEGKEPPAVPEIADKFDRLLRRAAAECVRVRSLTRLLNADVKLDDRSLQFRSGSLNGPSPLPGRLRWAGLGVETYDRMSILLAGLARPGRNSSSILPRPPSEERGQ